MKKILAVIITTVLALTLCLSVNAATLTNHSFDTIYVNDLETPAVDNGAAKAWSEENPIDAEIMALRVRGWAHIAESTIAEFGYKVDEGEAITSAEFIFDRADVQAAFGVEKDVANGFDIVLDLQNVGKGEHTITLVVKTADDSIIDITDFKVTQQLDGDGSGEVVATTPEATNPGTADASIIAIAALGTVALAGSIIVAKKIKK